MSEEATEIYFVFTDVTRVFKYCFFKVNFSLESGLYFRQNLQIHSAAQTVNSSYGI
jgi:hypothetical protein